MQLAGELGIECRETDLSLFDAYNAEEAFLTSTSLCLCPVRSINGTSLGHSAIPGPVTARLTQAYRELVGFDFIAQYRSHLRD
jgi:branched-chain amino acid aminotransferase